MARRKANQTPAPTAPPAVLIGTDAVLQYIVATLNRMDQHMSELTDQVDAALVALAQATEEALAVDAAEDAALLAAQAAVATAVAATAIVQEQLDAAKAGLAVDEAALQRALDGLNAANAALEALGQPPIVVDPPVEPPVEPTEPA